MRALVQQAPMRTIRRTLFQAAMTLVLALFVLMCGFVGAMSTPVSGFGTTALVGLLPSAGTAVVWTMGWYCKVRVGPQGVVIVNWLHTHTVPWSQVAGRRSQVADVRRAGAFALVLRSGDRLTSVQYGAALAGELTGYVSHRRLRGIVAEHFERYRDGDPAFAYAHPLDLRIARLKPPVLPLLAGLCAAEGVVVGAGGSSSRWGSAVRGRRGGSGRGGRGGGTRRATRWTGRRRSAAPFR